MNPNQVIWDDSTGSYRYYDAASGSEYVWNGQQWLMTQKGDKPIAPIAIPQGVIPAPGVARAAYWPKAVGFAAAVGLAALAGYYAARTKPAPHPLAFGRW